MGDPWFNGRQFPGKVDPSQSACAYLDSHVLPRLLFRVAGSFAFDVPSSTPPLTALLSLASLNINRRSQNECLRQHIYPEHDRCGEWRFRWFVRRISIRRCVPVDVATATETSIPT